jgi:hypothetical protein
MGRAGLTGMPVTVTLYGRAGCHLCDEARTMIMALASTAGGVELHEIDIESDERLLAAYLERIPVVEIAGREVSELVLDRDEFARALAVHTVGP